FDVKKAKARKEKADTRRQAVHNAHEHLKRTGDSIRKSAKLYSIPESTLRRHINQPYLTESCAGRPTVFTKLEEQQLAVHIKKMARLGYGYARWQVCQLAQNMLHTKGIETVIPQKDWYYGFIKRMDLNIQRPKKRELARVFGGSASNIGDYFIELETVLSKYNLMNIPASLWNVDETGITLDVPPPKIACGKGEQPFIVTSSRRATTTVIAAGNALGETIPPYVIYKGQRLSEELTKGCFPQTKFTMTKNGWSTAETFKDFLENHFLVHVKSRPCLLLYDGHATHITKDVIELAQKQNVHMFVIPPHSSHLVQPLDVGVFGPFKAALATGCHRLIHAEVGRQVTRSDLPKLIAYAYNSAMTVPNLMAAFRKTGIVPFNPEVLTNTVNDQYPTSEAKPKSRKERKDARNIKLLLNDIDKNVEKQLEETQAGKTKQYIIPNHGAAVTECEFVEKLKRKTEVEPKAHVKKPKSKSEPTCKQKVKKVKSVNTEQVVITSGDCKLKSNLNNKSDTPEVLDSQEPGPSNMRKEWLTFYHSNSDSSEGEDDDDALCVVCGQFAPTGFGKHGQLEILNWAKCDTCCGWVHLKYCTLESRLHSNEPFKCPKCQLN
ncbi:uncharacterized protein LOC128552342, partial [Mercenaria mercenaria]|uniref:uncharacterized protein LOC128552342 n=1 Tax=Mercenaria mercenaria TaxID=6596 RepID=UPI00234F8035